MPLTQLKGVNNKERLEKWFHHFKNLLGTPESNASRFENDTFFNNNKNLDLFPFNTKPFTIHQLQKLLSNVKNYKASGLGAIPMFLRKDPRLHEELPFYRRKTFEESKTAAFSTSCVKPILKTGDLGCTDNYRGIILIAISAKVYNLILLSIISMLSLF